MNFAKYQMILVGIAVLMAIIFLTSILKRLGLIKTRAKLEKEKRIQEYSKANYFNPAYYKTVIHRALPDTVAVEYAKELRKAMRGFGTNEPEIYSVFNKLDNKTQISELADKYFQLYKKDLQADIQNELTKSEIDKLMQVINSKPLTA